MGPVVMGMERHGVPFCVPDAQELLARVATDEAAVREKLDQWVADIDYIGPEMPPNWGSWQQLQYVLYTPLGLNLGPALYWKKGATGWIETDDGDYIPDPDRWNPDGEVEGEWKTDDKALEWLGWKHPEHKSGIDLIRVLRHITKTRQFLEKWLSLAWWHEDRKWWFLHPSFGLSNDNAKTTGTRTGRFSCSNPNLQQVSQDPPEGGYKDDDAHLAGYEYPLRRLFKAPPGYSWVVIDYTQLEIVLQAHIAHRLFGMTGLVDRMKPGAPDMHSMTAQYVYGTTLGDQSILALAVDEVKKKAKTKRNLIKAVRYGLGYGKGDLAFGDTLFLEDGTALGKERAGKMVQGLKEFDPEIPRYQEWVREFITQHCAIVSLMGRVQLLPDARAQKKGLRNRAWRQALNYPMQSGGQEIVLRAMIASAASEVLRKLEAVLMLQVHDELCWLVPTKNAEAAKEEAYRIMMTTTVLDAHLSGSGDIAESWGEAK